MNNTFTGIYEYPEFNIKITADDNFITCIDFINKSIEEQNPSMLCNTVNIQLKEYFNGDRKKFDFPFLIMGTEFQKAVYNALLTIPYGEVRSYKDIAVLIGRPDSSRAVGNAVGKNRLPIIVPCHRVIHSDGNINGFSCGNEIKKQLLKIEKVI